jgi:hypothetical protein
LMGGIECCLWATRPRPGPSLNSNHGQCPARAGLPGHLVEMLTPERLRSIGREEGPPGFKTHRRIWKSPMGIFAHKIPRRFRKISRIWLLLRGTAMWNLWKERNDAAFTGSHWHVDKLSSKIWLGMVDYGRLFWCRVTERCKNSPSKANKIKKQSRDLWCSNNLLASWVEDQPRWVLLRPNLRSLT